MRDKGGDGWGEGVGEEWRWGKRRRGGLGREWGVGGGREEVEID